MGSLMPPARPLIEQPLQQLPRPLQSNLVECDRFRLSHRVGEPSLPVQPIHAVPVEPFPSALAVTQGQA